jgi:PAS domain S-box-containing protein
MENLSVQMNKARDSVAAGVNQVVLERMPATNAALVFIFLAYAIFDYFVLPSSASKVMIPLTLGIAAGFALIGWLTARHKISPDYISHILALMAGLALASSFMLLAVVGQGEVSVNLLVVIFTASVFVTSRAWFIAIATVALAGWSIFVWTHSSVSPHYTLELLFGAILAAIVHEFARKMLFRMVDFKLRSEEQVDQIQRSSSEAYQSAILFRTVFDGMADAVYVKDQHGHYLLVNPAYLRDFGGPREGLLGRTAKDVFGPEAGKSIAVVEREVMRSGKSHIVEETVEQIGQIYLSNISPFFAQDGSIAGIIGISRNVTARKAEEKAREALVRQLGVAKEQA